MVCSSVLDIIELSFVKHSWPLLTAFTISILILFGTVTDMLPRESSPTFLALTSVLVLLQLFMNSRSGQMRERRLVNTARQLREVGAELDRLARTDDLTGLFNVRALNDLFGAEYRRSVRFERGIALLFLDIDRLKTINDEGGHAAGSAAIRSVAQALVSVLDESDIIGRWGGDEFIVVIPESDRMIAAAKAARILDAVAAIQVPGIGGRVSVSIGGAVAPVDGVYGSEAEFLQEADVALFRAKADGRGRIVWAHQ